jgi:predicted protein tyrosine phosphatase
MIRVLAQWQIQEFSRWNSEGEFALISICGYEDTPAQLEENSTLKEKLFLVFDDVEAPHKNQITKKQAKQIAKFVKENKDLVDGFIVNCMAGISRSAGVAAAILKYFTNDDTQIFDSANYCPNMTCYREVLNALMR